MKRILKSILFLLATVVVVVLISALFISKEYKVDRNITINKPKSEVFNYIKFLRNQDQFSVWARMDPKMKKGFSGTDGTPGAISSWEGNKDVGKGEQEIKSVDEGNRIDFELRFEKPMESIADAFMTTASTNDQSTVVTWGIKGTSPYPWNFMNLFMGFMLGGDLDGGLKNLKTVMEGGSLPPVK
jgi:hypothetical protein